MSTQPEPAQPVTDAGGPVTDGPNTHHYWTATHIWSWTIVDLDDVDGTTHHFHVPTAIADLLRSETTAAARAEVARQVHRLEKLPSGNRQYDREAAAWNEALQAVVSRLGESW